MNGTSVSNGTRLLPISISQRSFGNFPVSFGKWKTPLVYDSKVFVTSMTSLGPCLLLRGRNIAD